MKIALYPIEILVVVGLLVLNALSNLVNGTISSYLGIICTIAAVVIMHGFAVLVSDIRYNQMRRSDRSWGEEDWQ